MFKDFSSIQTVCFPLAREEDWQKVLPLRLRELREGPLVLDCQDWLLTYRDFQKIEELCCFRFMSNLVVSI